MNGNLLVPETLDFLEIQNRIDDSSDVERDIDPFIGVAVDDRIQLQSLKGLSECKILQWAHLQVRTHFLAFREHLSQLTDIERNRNLLVSEDFRCYVHD